MIIKLISQAYAATTDSEITNPALGAGVPKEAGAGLAFYIANLWRTVVVVGGVAFLLYLVWGGMEWMLAGGDKGKVEQAQHKITGALIGLAILVGSYAITLFVQGVFKINLLQPVFPSNI
jgi:hypothetical protein